MPEVTAVRTWNKPHTKATVTVTIGDDYVKKVGGERAGRCSYVLVYQRRDNGLWRFLGLRSEPRAEGTSIVFPITEEV